MVKGKGQKADVKVKCKRNAQCGITESWIAKP
jgi:hypothetical protein